MRASARDEGLRVFYRGHSATFLREALGTAAWFTAYEACLRTLSPRTRRDDVPTLTILLSGAFSGTVLNALPYPLDTAKSVMQTIAPGAGAPRSLVGAMRLIVEVEGVAGLYRGLSPALLRAIPTNAAVFVMYETLSRALRDWDAPRRAHD